MLQSKDIIYPELSFKINGILFGIRKNLGQYKNEQQYCDAIEEELKKNFINYEREKILPKSFEGEQKGRNKIDFLVEGKIILEVKAKQFITKSDYYQARRYLDSLDKKLCLLVNMRKYSVNPKRILNSKCSHN
jgi:GxxExxY protein